MSKPLFNNLLEALEFIEKCLSSGKPERLFDACLTNKTKEELQTRIFDELYMIHVKRRLRSLYLTRTVPLEFPEDGDKFKLGGHESELGHIHIDFVKKNFNWQLESIWQCR